MKEDIKLFFSFVQKKKRKHGIFYFPPFWVVEVLLQFLVMMFFQATNENLPPNVIKQLAKELKNLDESPPEGIKVGVNDDDFSIIYADIEGPGMWLYLHNFTPLRPCLWLHTEWTLFPLQLGLRMKMVSSAWSCYYLVTFHTRLPKVYGRRHYAFQHLCCMTNDCTYHPGFYLCRIHVWFDQFHAPSVDVSFPAYVIH